MNGNEDLIPLGSVSVDSGQVIIVDPCYLKYWEDGDYEPSSETHENSYDECCKATISKQRGGEVLDGLAVVSSTGWGDGIYPVYANKEEGRIMSLHIFFDGGPEEE